MNDMKYRLNYNPICPYCDYENREPFELEFGSCECTMAECGRCEKDYEVCRDISIRYCTYKTKEDKGNENG